MLIMNELINYLYSTLKTVTVLLYTVFGVDVRFYIIKKASSRLHFRVDLLRSGKASVCESV